MTDIQQLVQWRRYFHAHPEVSNDEFQTTEKLKEILEEMQIRVLNLPLPTGIVAEIGSGEPMVAVRSDIDALSIDEQTGLSFASKTKDVMHACGHDVHMAAILGLAMKLKARESSLRGRVRLIFQASEEVGFGAERIVDTGLLEGAKAIIGFHNDPTLKIGEWQAKPGFMTSNVDRFRIHIQAKGAHAAMPQDAKDPQVVLAQLIQSFQTIVSRNTAPFEEAVVTIGQVHSGQTWNVIPDSAMLEGTVRTFKTEVQSNVAKRMRTICDGVAKQYEVDIDLDYQTITQAVNNTPELHEMAMQSAQYVGYQASELERPLTIGEDFSGYQTVAPVYFAMIGSESEFALHHPKFNPDERILERVPDYFEAFVNRLLEDGTN